VRDIIVRPALRVTFGNNAVAELEGLCALGHGDFALGVHSLTNVLRERVAIAVELRDYPGHLFGHLKDRRDWVEGVYEDDAHLLAMLGGGVGHGISIALTVAWRHVPARDRERFLARLAELPDDDLAASRAVAGMSTPWHAPQTARGLQQHFADLR